MEPNKNAGFWELCFGRNSFLETGISVATYKGSYKQKCKFHSVSLRGYSPVHIILCGVRIANTSEWTLSISADTSEWSLWISADTSEWSLWISDTSEWSLWISDDTSEWSLWIYLSPQRITLLTVGHWSQWRMDPNPVLCNKQMWLFSFSLRTFLVHQCNWLSKRQ